VTPWPLLASLKLIYQGPPWKSPLTELTRSGYASLWLRIFVGKKSFCGYDSASIGLDGSVGSRLVSRCLVVDVPSSKKDDSLNQSLKN